MFKVQTINFNCKFLLRSNNDLSDVLCDVMAVLQSTKLTYQLQIKYLDDES